MYLLWFYWYECVKKLIIVFMRKRKYKKKLLLFFNYITRYANFLLTSEILDKIENKTL